MSDVYIPYDPKDHRIPKDDKEWHRFRNEGFDPTHPIPITFGGSDIGKIFLADREKKDFKYFMTDRAVAWMGSQEKAQAYLKHLNQETAFSSLLELYLEKYSRLKGDSVYVKKRIDNGSTRSGHAFEKYVAWLCEEALDCSINNQPGAYQHGHPSYDFIIANPDGLIDSLSGTFRTMGGTPVTLKNVKAIWEGKTLDPVNKSTVRDWQNDLIPFKYEMQVRLYMSTLNIDYAIISCAWGIQPNYSRHILVIRDLEMEARMLERIREFRDSIFADDPPPLDGTYIQCLDIMKRDLRKLSDPATTALLPEALYGQAAAQYAFLENRISEMEARTKLLKEQKDACMLELMAGMGPAAHGIVRAAGRTYRIKTSRSTRETVVKKILQEKYPGAWEECCSATPMVKFTMSESR